MIVLNCVPSRYVLLALFRRSSELVLASNDLVECLAGLRQVAAHDFVDSQLLIDLALKEQVLVK
jgi:hypothetical protein